MLLRNVNAAEKAKSPVMSFVVGKASAFPECWFGR